MIKHFLAACLCIAFSLPIANAQKAPIKWGKIPKADLEMTSYELDPEAEAVVLCDYGNLEFDLSSGEIKYVLKRHKRIKILKETGVDQGNITIPFYSFEGMEKVIGIDAKVFNPDGSKQTVKNGDIFTEKSDRYWSQKKFTFPNVQVGSVIEFRYKIESGSYFTLPEWYFQENIPVRYSELRLTIPEWYDYLIMNQGLALTKTENSRTNSKLLVPGYSVRTTQNVTGGNISSVRQGGFGQVDAQVVNQRFIMENAPALRSEPFITSMENYLSRLRFQLRGVQYPDEPYRPVLEDWNKLHSKRLVSESFGLQYTKEGKRRKAVAETKEMLKGIDSKLEKMKVLYSYLCKNYTWNEFYSISVTKSLNDVCNKKSGTSSELNLLLIALLREHDIESYPLMISTRSNGYPIQLYPIISQFNHVMAVATIEGKSYVLDVYDPVYPINFPRQNALNGSGWLLTDEQGQWIDLNVPTSSSTVMGTFELSPEGNAKGKIQIRYSGYDAIRERLALRSNSSGIHLTKQLAEIYPDIELENVQTKNLGEIYKPLSIKFDCAIPQLAQQNEEFLYCPSLVFYSLNDNPLQNEKREYPVEMLHPFKEKFIFNFIIPEGYAVEGLPEPAIVNLANNGGQIKYRASENGGKIQVLLDLSLTQTYYPPEEYEYIRNFFSLLIDKQNEQIILKKKT